jgi:hypothetical protein
MPSCFLAYNCAPVLLATGFIWDSAIMNAFSDPRHQHRPQGDGETYSPRAVLLALAVVLLLVFGGLFLFYALRDASKLQDCVMQGRTNCTEAVSPP